MLVTLIFISYLLCHDCCLAEWPSFLSCFLLVSTDPCGRGSVREHPRERTRTGGTDPARRPALETVLASAGKDGAVRPPSIPRNPRRAARAGALTPSAATYEAGV